MTNRVTARVTWVPAGSGGRSAAPGAGRYIAVARFDDPRADWSNAAWSVVLELHGPADADAVSVADARFLVPEAPHDLMRPGNHFELFEGNRRVAEVDLIPAPALPARSNSVRA